MPLESVERLVIAHRDRARRATERWSSPPPSYLRAQSEAARRLKASRSLRSSLSLMRMDQRPGVE